MEGRSNAMGRAANGTVHPVQTTHYKPRYVDCSLDNYKSYRSNAFRRLRKRLKRKGVVEVDFDHHRYKILMALRKGIRDLMLSHVQDPRQGQLRVDDFSQVEERQVTRSDGRVFVFESYADNVFLHLRQSLDISEPEFLESVAPEALPYLEFISNSNSGQKFYLSNDMKYMFKTEKESSIQFFFSILGDYLQHFQAYPHSLLVRFLGLHSIKLPREKKIYFLVMQSVFYPCERIQDRFDIKGFTTLRYQKPYHPNKNIITVLKDKNFKDEVIDVGGQKSWLRRQLAEDVEFLRGLGVQDYSLLVGRQPRRHRASPSLATFVHRVSRSLQPTAGFLPGSWASKTTSTTTLSHKSCASLDQQPHSHPSPQQQALSHQSPEQRAQALHQGTQTQDCGAQTSDCRAQSQHQRTPSVDRGDTESTGTLQSPRMKSAVSASQVGHIAEVCEAPARQGSPDVCQACRLAARCECQASRCECVACHLATRCECVACHLATRCEWGGEAVSLCSGDLLSDSCQDCQSLSCEDDFSECEAVEACVCSGGHPRREGVPVPASLRRTSDTPRSQSAPESSSVVLEEESPIPNASGSFLERSKSVPDGILSIPGKPSLVPQNPLFVPDKCVPPADDVSVIGAGKAVEFKVGSGRKNGFVSSLEELAISDQGVVVEKDRSETGAGDRVTRTVVEKDKSQNRSQLAVPGSRVSSAESDRSGGRNSLVTSLTPRDPGDCCHSALPAVESHQQRRSSQDFDAVLEGDLALGANSNHNNHHTELSDTGSRLDRPAFQRDQVHRQADSKSKSCYENGNVVSDHASCAAHLSSPRRAMAAPREKPRASVPGCACRRGCTSRVCSRTRTDCSHRGLGLRAGGGDAHHCHAARGPRPPRTLLPYPQSLEALDNAQRENRRLLPACENALHILDGPRHRYYLGIIDFFTRFQCRQRVGSVLHCCKTFDLFHSSVDPQAYASRFLRFIDEHLK